MITYEKRFEKTYIELGALLAELDDECEEMAKKQLVLMADDEWDTDKITEFETRRMAYTQLRRQLTKNCPFLILS